MVKLEVTVFNINIVHVYSPKQDHSEEEHVTLYDELSHNVQHITCAICTIRHSNGRRNANVDHEYPITGTRCLGETTHQ